MLETFGFGKEIIHLIFNKFEGQIDTGKYILNLTKLLGSMGAIFINGAEVLNTTSNNQGVEVTINNKFVGSSDQNYVFKGK